MTRLLRSREALLAGVLVLLVALVSTRFPGFVAPGNLASVFNDTSILIVLALGQTAVILTRCIDLSVAANLALTGMIVAMLNEADPGLPVFLLIALSAAIGLGLGAVNGLLVWAFAVPSIVVTLGTMTIYRGLAFVHSGGQWVNAHEMSRPFLQLPRQTFLGLPVLAWIALAIIAVMAVVLRRTVLGRAFYAVGGNPTAAVYAGFDIGRTQFYAFCISGTLAGLSGYLWVTRYAVAYVDIAGAFELQVVAACVIGGVSIAGGIGSAGGAVLGALFLGIVYNALPVVNVSPFWQMAISGTAIITAVALNARSERRIGRPILRPKEASGR